ncbi:SDR family oxidoreductase [Tahibacter amnicola]|uniref:SDR family oxidoreductase n=1 Tax=Tahibacter amnicola TaxID=2976241 RepID=A0ABY6BCU0_9GAMM|nr:SDR family oxidoreductase [Tahibacter amnicola]UXI66145.1 SDR family oxidoreductase [Tahibacter amnicola]
MTQKLLVTGATGFLGSAFFANAFQLGYAADCLLLVRGADEAACRARLARSLERALGPERAAAAAQSCAILRGDLQSLDSHPDPRLDLIERVVHLAADTSFTAGRSVWSTNVDGTLSLARRARHMPRLARFLHVGTAFCCGESPRHTLVHEAPPPGTDAPHIVEYTRSKAAAERALAAQFADLPIVVARPSIVVGDSQLGCAVSSSIFWFLRLVDRTGLLPCSPDEAIDIVTSDWVAQRLHDLTWKPVLAHTLYHVAAGAAGATSWHAMAAAFASAGHAGSRPYTTFDPQARGGWSSFTHAFARAFPERDVLRRTMALAARTYHRFVAQAVTFDDTHLRAEGFAPSAPFADYVATCLARPGGTIESQFYDDARVFGLPVS